MSLACTSEFKHRRCGRCAACRERIRQCVAQGAKNAGVAACQFRRHEEVTRRLFRCGECEGCALVERTVNRIAQAGGDAWDIVAELGSCYGTASKQIAIAHRPGGLRLARHTEATAKRANAIRAKFAAPRKVDSAALLFGGSTAACERCGLHGAHECIPTEAAQLEVYRDDWRLPSW